MQSPSWHFQPNYKPVPSSNPTTPDAFEGPYFGMNIASQALTMQGDSASSPEDIFLHARRGSDSSSSFDESLHSFPSSAFLAGLHLSGGGVGGDSRATQGVSPSQHQPSQLAHVGLAGSFHQGHPYYSPSQNLNQPLSHHLHPALSNNGATTINRAYSNFGDGNTISPIYVAHTTDVHPPRNPPQGSNVNLAAAAAAAASVAAGVRAMTSAAGFHHLPEWNAFNVLGGDSHSHHHHSVLSAQATPAGSASIVYAPLGVPNKPILPFQDPYGSIGFAIDAQIRQYASPSDTDGSALLSPSMNSVSNGGGSGGGGLLSGLSMGVGISMHPSAALMNSHHYQHYLSPSPSLAPSQILRAPSRSSASTPSLVCTSPQGITSPSLSVPVLAGPALFHSVPSAGFSRSGSQETLVDTSSSSAPPLPESSLLLLKPQQSTPNRKSKAKAKSSSKSPSPNQSATSSFSSAPAPSPSPTASHHSAATPAAPILDQRPLSLRIAALSEKKRRMLEEACGDRWTQVSDSSSPSLEVEDESERRKMEADLQLVEIFLALIGSEELAAQLEIPDRLVQPVLETVLLPKASAKQGSRGGAACYRCRWAGCGKEIRRKDHAKNHVREHVKSKPHACGGSGAGKGCGQRFLRNDDLKRHIKAHCSILQKGPTRRPRSVRGVRRNSNEDDDDDEEDDERGSVGSDSSIHGGDDDEYRPVTRAIMTTTTNAQTTRELATRLRNQRKRAVAAAVVVREASSELSATEEDDSGSVHEPVRRLQTSHVRGTNDDGSSSPSRNVITATTPVEHNDHDLHDNDDDGSEDEGVEMRMEDGHEEDGGMGPGV